MLTKDDEDNCEDRVVEREVQDEIEPSKCIVTHLQLVFSVGSIEVIVIAFDVKEDNNMYLTVQQV